MYESHSSSEPYDGHTQIERLYLCVSSLDIAPALDPALGEILRLLADVTRCELAYVEIDDYALGHAQYALPPGALRARVSRELLQRSIAECATVEATVPGDARRWREPSVALSTPIGAVLPIGALYVERAGPFTPFEKERLRSVARNLAKVWPSVRRGRKSLTGELQELKERRIRESMERHRGNIAEVARALGVSRTFVYRVLEQRVAARDSDAGRSYSNDTDQPDMKRDETQIASDHETE